MLLFLPLDKGDNSSIVTGSRAEEEHRIGMDIVYDLYHLHMIIEFLIV